LPLFEIERPSWLPGFPRNLIRFSALAIVLSFLASALPARAHNRIMGVYRVGLAEDRADFLLRLDAIDLGTFLHLDVNGDEVYDANELLQRRDRIERYLAERLTLNNNGEPCDDFSLSRMQPNGPLPRYVDFAGTIRCSAPLGQVEVGNTALMDYAAEYIHYVEVIAPEERVEAVFSRDEYQVTVRAGPGAVDALGGSGQGPASAGGSVRGEAGQWLHRVGLFLKLGVEHIFIGLDHILFILGLTIAARDLRRLLVVVTAFTLAHSITLALASLDVISVPILVVESLIALSVAYVGLENLLRDPRHRGLVAFGFGLVHGIGFSSVLAELMGGMGMGGGQRLQMLLGFNLGVEVGQIVIVVAVFPLVGWLRRHRWERPLVVPASAIICVFGLVWFVDRAFLGG
jgi:hydrogenase/urease accessory protein HupE